MMSIARRAPRHWCSSARCFGLLICALWIGQVFAADTGADADPEAAVDLRMLLEPLQPTGWIPRLWEPVATVAGPLDDDDLPEVALLLHRTGAIPEDPTPVGAHGLAIFSLNEEGRYELALLADRLLPCVDCLGSLRAGPGDNPFDIEIEDRRLTIGWLSDVDALVSVRLSFAWNPDYQAYALVADDLARAGRTREITSRRTRDFIAGKEQNNGDTIPIVPRFVPMDEVEAKDYR